MKFSCLQALKKMFLVLKQSPLTCRFQLPLEGEGVLLRMPSAPAHLLWTGAGFCRLLWRAVI